MKALEGRKGTAGAVTKQPNGLGSGDGSASFANEPNFGTALQPKLYKLQKGGVRNIKALIQRGWCV